MSTGMEEEVRQALEALKELDKSRYDRWKVEAELKRADMQRAIRTLDDEGLLDTYRDKRGEIVYSISQDETHSVTDEWERHANLNVDEWGQQDVDVLLLAIQEEVGELTQTYLESIGDGSIDVSEMEKELCNLTALCFQLQWRLEDER